MNRLLKRHKRQVARAREKVRASVPDVRTPEQRQAARDASQAVMGRHRDPQPLYSKPMAQPGPPAEKTASEEAS